MWESPFMTTHDKEQATATVKNILAQATKPELSKYYHDAILRPKIQASSRPPNKVSSIHGQA